MAVFLLENEFCHESWGLLVAEVELKQYLLEILGPTSGIIEFTDFSLRVAYNSIRLIQQLRQCACRFSTVHKTGHPKVLFENSVRNIQAFVRRE